MESPRRDFLNKALLTSSLSLGAALIPHATAVASDGRVKGQEYWTHRQVGDARIDLYLWRKRPAPGSAIKGTILFVHGSSMGGPPVFDLEVPGQPQYGTMDHFVALGYDTWCCDCEGYGRSSKSRNINFDISNGADDLEAISAYILKETGQSQLLVYGLSSGSLRAALLTERHPERVSRLALDAFVWTGEGSDTLTKRRARIQEWTASNRRPIDLAMIQSIFTRDHPGTADPRVVQAFAEAVLATDSSVPTGSYVDMSVKLPLCTPSKNPVPTMIMRGEFDGIAGFADLLNYFALLPSADKRFVVMPGIAHSSLHEKNVKIVHKVLADFFDQPKQV